MPGQEQGRAAAGGLQGVLHLKLSCQTAGRVRRKKKTMEERGAKKLRESSESNGESNMSGKEWLRTFSTMKVGPLKHIKPVAKLRHATSGARLTS